MNIQTRIWGFVLITVGFRTKSAVVYFVAKRIDLREQGDGRQADKRLLTLGDRG